LAKAGLLALAAVGVAAAGSYVLGMRVPGLALLSNENKAPAEVKPPPPSAVVLVKGKPHTVEVSEEVRTTLGIRKGRQDQLAVARTPTTQRAMVLPGSTALDPTGLARIRARFAPARVVSIGQVPEFAPKSGQTEYRELRPGDHVRKGGLLGVFYSVDVGSKKNDLLDALVQLEQDQKILDEAEKHREAVPEVFLLTSRRAVQGDRNNINRALNNLETWDIPQDEIDALRAEARRISADKDAWFKTREGRWVKGEKQPPRGVDARERENPWGRVTLRAPFDGVIVERNLAVNEMVVDNTVNLFQIAQVNRLLVIANAPEDDLPTLQALKPDERVWTVRTVGRVSANGLPGTIDEIGYLIDPNQHTAVIKGYINNPGEELRAGQYVSASVRIPPPDGVVEIPAEAVVSDGNQSFVFVQGDPANPHFTLRRVAVTHRFEHTVFVRSRPVAPAEEQPAEQAEEVHMAVEPLRPGERVLPSGAVELKAALLNLESQPEERARKERR
jgi:cobalt-zinc-cadmium efflux system membrane fusion protein